MLNFSLLWLACEPSLVEQKNNFDSTVIEVGTADTLVVKTFNGGITLRPSNNDKILVKSILRQPDQIDYQIENNKTEILITASQSKRDVRPIPGASFEIEVPKSLHLNLTSKNGSVVATYLQSNIKIRASNGSVSISESDGLFDVEVKEGNIYLDNVEGGIKAHANKGNIELNSSMNKPSAYDLKTKSGNVYLSLPSKSISKLDIKAESKNGTINNFSSISDSDPKEHKFASTPQGSVSSLKATADKGSIEIDSY